jgi:hypothetical protein
MRTFGVDVRSEALVASRRRIIKAANDVVYSDLAEMKYF